MERPRKRGRSFMYGWESRPPSCIVRGTPMSTERMEPLHQLRDRARRAAMQGDGRLASTLFAALLAREPADVEGSNYLAMSDLAAGHGASAGSRLPRALER